MGKYADTFWFDYGSQTKLCSVAFQLQQTDHLSKQQSKSLSTAAVEGLIPSFWFHCLPNIISHTSFHSPNSSRRRLFSTFKTPFQTFNLLIHYFLMDLMSVSLQADSYCHISFNEPINFTSFAYLTVEMGCRHPLQAVRCHYIKL